VTTANNATAQIRIANPGPTPANVTLNVTLKSFHVPNQTLSVPPYGSAVATITPNSAIPAAGYARVSMTSSQPVIVALATGTGKDIALSAPSSPQPEYLIGDFTGKGFDGAELTNTSSKSITVSITRLSSSGAKLLGTQFGMTGDESLALSDSAFAKLPGVAVVVKSSRPSLEVTLALPTRPAGMTVVSGLDGR
jgi:hypothetical protein